MSGIFDTFGGSIKGDVLTFNPDAIPTPDTLHIRMTRGERRIADELRKEFGGFKRVIIDVDGEQHGFSADSLIRLLEGYEGSSSQECHATQPNYEHCKYSTNRGWCDTSRYAALFGTPERAARTWIEHCDILRCADCPICHDEHGETCEVPGDCVWVDEEHGPDALLEWLGGDA